MARGTIGHAPKGWYQDPSGRAARRYWSGSAWTSWVFDGTSVSLDAAAPRRLLRPADVSSLEFVQVILLPELRSAGIVSLEQSLQIADVTRSMIEEAVASPPQPPPAQVLAEKELGETIATRPPSPARPEPTPSREPAPIGPKPAAEARPSVSTSPTRLVPRQPGPFARWWDRGVAAVGSDLSLHGLAYLGVLLLFVGAFGLVAFAFGDVAPDARPVAEIAIAASPFVAAGLLLRRGARIAGRALELAGGLLLPVMLITSFLDGVGVPPDQVGPMLLVTLTVVAGVTSALYALWSARHPASALRYLVAPTAWLAVGLATMGVGREIPSGQGVASITAAQVTAMAAAMVLSAALARWRTGSRLSAPTLTVCVPGAVLIGVLAMLTWLAEQWPVIPIAVTGVLGLVLLELLDVRLPADLIGLVEPLWWSMVVLALVPGLGAAPSGALATAGFVALLENTAARRPSAWPTALTSAGVVLALMMTLADPWWATGTLAVTAVWAHVRRLRPFSEPAFSAAALDTAAMALPAAAVVTFGLASGDPAAAVGVAAALVLGSTLPAVRPVLRRDATDDFWPRWWRAAAFAVAVAAGITQILWLPAAGSGSWLLAGALSALAASVALGPVNDLVRPWCVLALATWSWLLACGALTVTDTLRGSVIAVGALAVVIVADVAGVRWLPERAGQLGLAGHALGLIALVLVGVGWGLALGTGLATIGWIVTTAYDARDHSPVVDLMARPGAWARFVPPALAATGTPATVAIALDAADVVTFSAPWSVAVLAATAVGYASMTHARLGERVTTVLVWGSFAAGVAAAALSRAAWPAATALAALILAVALLPRSRRKVFMAWVAWAAVAPLAGLVAVETVDWLTEASAPTAAAVVLVAVGGVMAVMSAAVDLIGGSWAPRWLPARPAALAPLVLGVVEVAAGVAVAWVLVGSPVQGWLTGAAAVITLALAVLTRAGVLSGVAATLGWMSFLLLGEDEILARPLIAVAVTAGLLLAAEAATRRGRDTRWWARWDAGLFAAAHLTAWTALVAAADGASLAPVFVLVGLLAVLVAIRMRGRRWVALGYSCAGTLFVLVGAADAGPGWLALAFLALSVGLTMLAVPARGIARWLLQFGGAVTMLAAWIACADWLSWTGQRTADVTAVGASMLALGLAVAVRTRVLGTSWAIAWGVVTGLVASVVCGAVMLPSVEGLPLLDPSPLTATSLLVLAVAAGVAARPLAAGWLRDLAAAALFGAQLQALTVGGATGGQQVAVLAATSMVGALAALGARDASDVVVWRRPALEFGAASIAAALTVSIVADAGSGWLGLALVTLSAVLTVSAVQARGASRWVLQFAGAFAAVAGWIAIVDWLEWADQRSVDVTSFGASLLVLGLAVAVRTRIIVASWAIVWGAVGASTTVVVSLVTLVTAIDGESGPQASAATSASLLVLALAFALAAAPLKGAWLGDLAAASVLGAEVNALAAGGATAAQSAGVLVATSILCAVLALVARERPGLAGALRPTFELGVATVVAALGVAVSSLPDTILFVPVLLAGALQAAALGVVIRSVAVEASAPVLACAAWLTFAADALGGNPQWYTVPIGLTMLVVVGLLRQDARVRGADPAAPGIVVLELVGIGFLAGACFVQSVTDSLAYALVAAGVGLAVGAWGTITKVRRRVAGGLVIVLAALLELIAVPLVRLLPAWGGVGVWVLIFSVGLLAIAAATLLEEGRTAVRKAMASFGERTRGWE